MTQYLSNGFDYTDSYGQCMLPLLADEVTLDVAGDVTKDTYHRDDICNGCHGRIFDASVSPTPTESLVSRSYPCILKVPGRFFDEFPAIDRLGVYCLRRKVACWAEFTLCPKCLSRADAIAEVSDHVACGYEWEDLCDDLHRQVTNEGLWQKYAGGQQTLARAAAKTMALLEGAVVDEGQTGPLSLLPRDVLYVMLPHVVDGVRNQMARKIQAVYRGWRQRARSPALKWVPGEGVSCRDAIIRKMWMNCEDCGMSRNLRDLHWTDACADQNGCCTKYVCRSSCCYKCPICEATNFVKSWDKKGDGSSTWFDCTCGETILLHEMWHGMSVAAHEARYG